MRCDAMRCHAMPCHRHPQAARRVARGVLGLPRRRALVGQQRGGCAGAGAAEGPGHGGGCCVRRFAARVRPSSYGRGVLLSASLLLERRPPGHLPLYGRRAALVRCVSELRYCVDQPRAVPRPLTVGATRHAAAHAATAQQATRRYTRRYTLPCAAMHRCDRARSRPRNVASLAAATRRWTTTGVTGGRAAVPTERSPR